MDAYIEKHLAQSGYRALGDGRYLHPEGWTDVRIGAHAVFAHRDTEYTAETFHDALHAHPYTEILFWHGGDVQYVSRDRVAAAGEGRVIVIPPHTEHTTRLLSPSRYERTVLYVSPAFAGEFSEELDVLFSPSSSVFVGTLAGEKRVRAEGVLCRIAGAVSEQEGDRFSAFVAVSELLLLVKGAVTASDAWETAEDEAYLPKPVREIRHYIETSYASIESVGAIAERFYYSREYVTRLFRKYYNLGVGQYLEQCRIREAEVRILRGERVADVCFAVGYRSISAFSAAFRRVTGRSPTGVRR
ncbi:MAG: helix-turn-helix transcriptional regulator [Clostridia bacterium]|nr:helix-turn-helix transcriptional regulator [Clostridia bacterium]